MGAHGKKSSSNAGGTRKKPSRQASLLRKPVIEVRGKLGKAQKSKKKKIKKIVASTVDFYESKVEDRDKSIKEGSGIINSAPKNLQQEIPKKLRELMKTREQVIATSNLSKRKRKAIKLQEFREQEQATESWFKRPVAAVPKFEKKPGESDRAFYSRVEVESNEFVKIAKYEDENECKVTKNEKGQIEIQKKVRRKQIKTKEFREKKKAQKQSKLVEHRDFTDLTDHVAFNERTDRPPEILAVPRKAKEKAKSDKLSSLNLMGMIGAASTSNQQTNQPQSWAYKERLQGERQRAIDLYRSMKAVKKSDPLT